LSIYQLPASGYGDKRRVA